MKHTEFNETIVPKRSKTFLRVFWGITAACLLLFIWIIVHQHMTIFGHFRLKMLLYFSDVVIGFIPSALIFCWAMFFLVDKLRIRVFYRKDKYWSIIKKCPIPFALISAVFMADTQVDFLMGQKGSSEDVAMAVFIFILTLFLAFVLNKLFLIMVDSKGVCRALFCTSDELWEYEKAHSKETTPTVGFWSSLFSTKEIDDAVDEYILFKNMDNESWTSENSYTGSHGEFDGNDFDRAINEDIQQFRSSDKDFDAEAHFGWEHEMNYESDGYDD